MTCELCERFEAEYQRVIRHTDDNEIVEVCEHCKLNFCPENGYHIVLPAGTDFDPADADYPLAVSK